MREKWRFSNGGFREIKRDVERESVKVEDEFGEKRRVTMVKTFDRSP